jgi:hypothetical protein
MIYCDDIITLTCDTCYELENEWCAVINVNPGLTPATDYYLQIIDKFSKRRTQAVAIESDGSFTVDQSLLPNGFFNPYAGKFELYLSTNSAGTDYVDLTFSATVYSCIILTITQTPCTNIYVVPGYVECAYVE